MERTSEEVNRQLGRDGRHRSCMCLLCKIIAALLVFPAATTAQTFDVLIIEKPQYLTVYNSFQQFVPPATALPLQPFAPMRILKPKELLSDSVTECMKVEVDGEVFYLLYDQHGKLAGTAELGMVKTFKNKFFLGDTVEILESKRLGIQSPFTTERSTFLAGDRCIRYFKDGGMVYIKRLGKDRGFGWTLLPPVHEGRLWRVMRTRLEPGGLPPNTLDRVKARIQQVNEVLSRIYSLLRRETGKSLPAPQWHVKSDGTTVSCILEPYEAGVRYEQSIEALTATFQAYFLGTGIDATAVGNRIEIKRQRPSGNEQ